MSQWYKRGYTDWNPETPEEALRRITSPSVYGNQQGNQYTPSSTSGIGTVSDAALTQQSGADDPQGAVTVNVYASHAIYGAPPTAQRPGSPVVVNVYAAQAGQGSRLAARPVTVNVFGSHPHASYHHNQQSQVPAITVNGSGQQTTSHTVNNGPHDNQMPGDHANAAPQAAPVPVYANQAGQQHGSTTSAVAAAVAGAVNRNQHPPKASKSTGKQPSKSATAHDTTKEAA